MEVWGGWKVWCMRPRCWILMRSVLLKMSLHIMVHNLNKKYIYFLLHPFLSSLSHRGSVSGVTAFQSVRSCCLKLQEGRSRCLRASSGCWSQVRCPLRSRWVGLDLWSCKHDCPAELCNYAACQVLATMFQHSEYFRFLQNNKRVCFWWVQRGIYTYVRATGFKVKDLLQVCGAADVLDLDVVT